MLIFITTHFWKLPLPSHISLSFFFSFSLSLSFFLSKLCEIFSPCPMLLYVLRNILTCQWFCNWKISYFPVFILYCAELPFSYHFLLLFLYTSLWLSYFVIYPALFWSLLCAIRHISATCLNELCFLVILSMYWCLYLTLLYCRTPLYPHFSFFAIRNITSLCLVSLFSYLVQYLLLYASIVPVSPRKSCNHIDPSGVSTSAINVATPQLMRCFL